MDFLTLRLRFYQFLSNSLIKHPRLSCFMGLSDQRLYFFGPLQLIPLLMSTVLLGMLIPLLNVGGVLHMSWQVATLSVLGGIFLSVGIVWFLHGIFSYRKLLDSMEIRKLKDKLKYMEEPFKGVFIQWQSRRLTVRRYHRRALDMLEALQHHERIHSQILREHRQFSEETGARELYEQRRLQQHIPQTTLAHSAKRL